MSFKEPLSFEELDKILHYDPETGIFLWKSKTGKKVLVGNQAGSVRRTRERADGGGYYRYIRVLGKSMPAARVAWCLHHGEWPLGKIYFNDGDTLNLKIANLRVSSSVPGEYDHSDPDSKAEYNRAYNRQRYLEIKDRTIETKFGLSLGEYGKMLVAQNGVCAICGGEEKATRNGRVKALAVDHDHETKVVRGLLCSECNQMLGKAKDSREILLAAVRYLDKHSGRESSKPALTIVSTEDKP